MKVKLKRFEGKGVQVKGAQISNGQGPKSEGRKVTPLPLDAEAQGVLARLAAPDVVHPDRPVRDDSERPAQPRPERPQQVRRGERRNGPVDDGHTPATQRLFYSLKVPREIAGPLAHAQQKLRGNWRSVRPDQMHVTLAYLPAVPTERVPELKALGQRLSPQFGTLDVRLRGTGYFPNEGSPRVWFVKVEAEGLDALAAALRAAVLELGLEIEDTPFKGHITLARRKGPAPRVPPMTFESSWHATGVTLQRSLLQKTGPIYEQAGSYRLREGPTATAPPEAATTDSSPSDPAPTSHPTQETP
ncbi:RNA 2',3'-cyclic phosphodiesterase [Deinococcus sp.]|uniref:RNA 2',3'-cyclic phosphodiesterase n=1 Tax=Deinococcus sp. TaxID=47478 RepID=UPI002869BCB5|nr:RNA 2',3'-cyclic phosphodiesterase [Deinococcus sp.]